MEMEIVSLCRMFLKVCIALHISHILSLFVPPGGAQSKEAGCIYAIGFTRIESR
jgi:hypothetical protein